LLYATTLAIKLNAAEDSYAATITDAIEEISQANEDKFKIQDEDWSEFCEWSADEIEGLFDDIDTDGDGGIT